MARASDQRSIVSILTLHGVSNLCTQKHLQLVHTYGYVNPGICAHYLELSVASLLQSEF